MLAEVRVDIGIVVRDAATALAFDRDTLGLEDLGSLRFPHAAMHRLKWGDSLVKLTQLTAPPAAAKPPGGHHAAFGIRYLTLTVPDLDSLVTRCAQAGYEVTMPRAVVRPGVEVAFVADPDGNPVEFLQV